MDEDFKELYDMLSSDRDDIRKIKDSYEKEVSVLLGRVRSYHVDSPMIAGEYDLNTNFLEYKRDDAALRFNLNIDLVEYKISLLQGYLQDLFVEKKFIAYKKDKEEKLDNNDYVRYIKDPTYRSELIASWYEEFMR